MAGESVFDGLVNIRVEDNNATAQVAAIVDAVTAELRTLNNVGGVNIGEDILQGLGPASTKVADLVEQVQRLLTVSREINQLTYSDRSQGMVQGLEHVLALLNQISAEQGQINSAGLRAEAEAARARRAGGAGGAGGGQPPAPPTFPEPEDRGFNFERLHQEAEQLSSRAHESIVRIETEMAAADPGNIEQYSKINAQRADFERARLNYEQKFAILMEGNFKDADAQFNAEQAYRASYSTLQKQGLTLVEAENEIIRRRLAQERAQGAGGAPGTIEQLNAAIRTAVPAQGTDRLVARQATFQNAMDELQQAQLAVENGDLDARKRYVAALGRFNSASEALREAILKREAEQLAATTQAAGGPVSGRQALLQANRPAREFLAAETGVDPAALGAARSEQLKVELRRVVAEQQGLAEKAKENLTQAEINRLYSQKLALASREVQLEQQIAAAKAREERESKGSGGFIGGVFGRNRDESGGFGGDFAFQAGITFKYYALYSAFATGQRILEDLLETTRQYTDAVNQLAITLDTTQEAAGQYAETFADIGSTLGIGPLRAIQGATDYLRTFRDEQGRIQPGVGPAGAAAASLIFTLEPDDHAEQVVQDLLAVTKAFQLGAEGSLSAYDQMLQVAQQFGYTSAGQVSPGVAAIADIGRESGYSLPELTALVAGVMRQTGVGSDAAAGDLKRILGSQQEPGIVRLFRYYLGAESGQQTFAQNIKDLNAVLSTRTDEERRTALLSIGSPRTAAAFQGIIASVPEQQRAIAAAEDPNRRTAERQAQDRLNELSGALQKFRGEVERLLVEIGRSGLLGVFGVIVQTGTKLISVLNEIFQWFNKLPDPVKEVIAAFVTLAAISKAQAFFRGSGAAGEAAAGGLGARFGLSTGAERVSIFGGTGRGFRFAEPAATGAAAGAVAGGYRFPEAGQVTGAFGQSAEAVTAQTAALAAQTAGTAEATVAAGGFTGAMVRTGAALKGAAAGAVGLMASLAPLIALTVGVTMVSDAFQEKDTAESNVNQIPQAIKERQDALARGDVEAARNATQRISQLRANIEASTQGVTGTLMDVFSGFDDARMDLYKRLDTLDADSAKQIEDMLAHRKEIDAKLPLSEWWGKNYQQWTAGVELLTTKGAGADTVGAATRDILSNADYLTQGAFITPGEGQKGLPDALNLFYQRLARVASPTQTRAELEKMQSFLIQLRTQAAAVGDDTRVEAISTYLDDINQRFSAVITQSTQDKLDILKKHFTGGSTDTAAINIVLSTAIQDMARTGDVKGLVSLFNQADKAFVERVKKNLEDQQAILDAQALALEGVAALMAAADPANKWKKPGAQAGLPGLGGGPVVGGQADAAKAAAEEGQRQLDAVLEAVGLADPTGEVQSKLQNTLAIARAKYAARPGDAVAQAAAETKAASLKVAELNAQGLQNTADWFDAMKALADATHNEKMVRLQAELAKGLAGLTAGDDLGAAKLAVDNAQKELDATSKGTLEYYEKLKALHDAQRAYAEGLHQLEANQRAARVIPGDPLSQAKAEVTQAREDLKFAVDSREYYQKLKELRDAQHNLAEIELEMAHNARLLGIDITDPVAQAREAVRVAAAKLQYDRNRGADRDVLLADEVSLRQTRSDAEGAAWQQQFQDQQTNYNLQRTSLSAYLSYLRAQHDYLTAVQHRTRQQQEELNQVDQALQSLTQSMQGQWNLGDIKVPTAYEMRRALGAGTGASYEGQPVTINFYGSAEAEMKRAIESVMGQPALQTSGTTPPRV